MEEVRTFVAVSLDLRATRRVADVQAKVHQTLGPRSAQLRWVPPTNLHVTVKFLGAIDAQLVAAIRDAIRRVAAKTRTFRVRAKGLGAFPDALSPKVLWLGVEAEGGALDALSAAIDDALHGIGFPKEKRKFHAHLTLARVKDAAGLALGAVFEQVGPADCGDSAVSEVVVYRSDGKPSGAEYEALERIPLAPRGQEGPGGSRGAPTL
jgi:2'-5' RNA ligase